MGLHVSDQKLGKAHFYVVRCEEIKFLFNFCFSATTNHTLGFLRAFQMIEDLMASNSISGRSYEAPQWQSGSDLDIYLMRQSLGSLGDC